MMIITHAHADHINNLTQVRELTDAEVVIGDGDEDALETRTGIRPEIILGQSDVIGAYGNIELVHIPGHSPGNLCLYLHRHKAIIAGDTIFGDSEGTLEAPPEKYCTNVDQAWRNLSILAEYDSDVLLLSHCKNTYEKAKEKVLKLIKNCA